MPSIELIMGGNSQSNNSKNDEVRDAESLQVETESLVESTTPDVCSQDAEKHEHIGSRLKRKRNFKKLYTVKRSRSSRIPKETPFKRAKESPEFESSPSEAFKSPEIYTTPVASEYQEVDEIDYGDYYGDIKPIPRRYFYKSRCKSISKYWQSVERYCRAITKSDIKFLNQLIAKQEQTESVFYNIPPLGEHYSLRWAVKELTDEQMASCPNAGRPRQRMLAPSPSSALNLLKKGSNSCNESMDSESKSNSLQSFLTENLNQILEENDEQSNSENFLQDRNGFQQDSEISNSYDSVLVKFPEDNGVISWNGTRHLNTNNSSLENCLKRDLAEIGITSNGSNGGEEDDEIVTEMKRCIAQMNALGEINITQLKRCLKLAEVEMKRQEVRQKLRLYDSEIVTIHQKIQTAKQKKEPVNKRDRDRAWKLLKNRESLLKELD